MVLWVNIFVSNAFKVLQFISVGQILATWFCGSFASKLKWCVWSFVEEGNGFKHVKEKKNYNWKMIKNYELEDYAYWKCLLWCHVWSGTFAESLGQVIYPNKL